MCRDVLVIPINYYKTIKSKGIYTTHQSRKPKQGFCFSFLVLKPIHETLHKHKLEMLKLDVTQNHMVFEI